MSAPNISALSGDMLEKTGNNDKILPIKLQKEKKLLTMMEDHIGGLLARNFVGQSETKSDNPKSTNKIGRKEVTSKNKNTTKSSAVNNAQDKNQPKKRKALPLQGSKAREAKRKEQIIKNREMSKTSRSRKEMRFQLLEKEMKMLQHKVNMIIALKDCYDKKSTDYVLSTLLEHHEFWNRLNSLNSTASLGVVVEEKARQQILDGTISVPNTESTATSSRDTGLLGFAEGNAWLFREADAGRTSAPAAQGPTI